MKEEKEESEKPKKSKKSRKKEDTEDYLDFTIEPSKMKGRSKRNKYLKSDPYYDSNVFSRLFYIFGYYIIKYIREDIPSPSNIGGLKNDNKSKNYSKKLINKWNHSMSKNLLKIILRINIFPLIFILIGSFIQASLTVYTVDLFKSLIKSYTSENEKSEIKTAYKYFGVQFFLLFFDRKLNEYQTHIGYRIGYQLDCLIYNKLMYSKSFKKFVAKNKQIITTADIINYIEIDTYKLIASILLIPSFVTLPYSLGLYFKMLWSFFNVPFLYGCFVFFIFMLMNFFFLSKYRYYQIMEQIYKDETMKKILLTFNNIENVKLNGEEIDYIKKIYEKKNKEMAFFSDKRYINNVNQALLWFAPIAMTIMTVFMYQYHYKETEIEVENIYTFLNIFIKINGPVRNIPATLQCLYETYVSMQRIQNFLQSSEKNEGISYYEKNNIDLINKRIMVQIDKGTFSWGKQKQKDKDKEKNNEEKDENNDLNKEIEDNKKENEKDNINIINTESDKKITIDINNIDKEPLIPKKEEKSDEEINKKEDTDDNVKSFDFLEETRIGNEIDYEELEVVLQNINLTVNKGDLVVIYGKSGSGKTSLLEAILNEMQFIINRENKFNVITTVNGKTSYVAQIPFIYNSTVRQNIAFDLSQEVKLNHSRYFDVIDICSLRQDLSELNGGDLTEIGENGINLSSGQIRRIAIARCLYAKKDIYLFDQPTFNIDKNAGWKILYDGIYKFLKNKTRIVVTDNEKFAQYADKIIILKKGEIIFNGSYYDLSQSNINKDEGFNFIFNPTVIEEQETMKEIETNANYTYHKTSSMNTFDKTSSTSTVSTEEFISSSNALICHDLGKKHISQKALTYKTTKDEKKSTYRYRLTTFSAPIPYLEGIKLIIYTFFIIFEWQLTINGSDLWMVFWNNNQGHGLKKNWKYLVVYASFGLLGSLCVYLRNRFTCKSTNNFVKNLNFHMVYHLVKAPINTFFSETPMGQMVNRLSYDLNNIEDNFYKCWVNILSIGTSLIIRMIICIYFMWGSVFLLFIITILLILISRYYISSVNELNRIECYIRTPLINFVNETTIGKSTIKAFNLVDDFVEEFYKKLDKLYKCRIWINLSFQFFGFILSVFTFSLDIFLILEAIYGNLKQDFNVRPEIYGLLLNYLFSFKEEMKNFQLSVSELQGVMISFERANEYNNIFSENYSNIKKKSKNEDNNYKKIKIEENDENHSYDINFNFSNGKIQFEKYSLKYKPEGKLVLKEINFTINSGEKIAIMGKTGCGKSSLIYAITRIIEANEGKILINDIDISTIPLQILRKNIGVLSQNNGISEGSFLFNLDPLGKFSDYEIKDALKKLDYWYNKEEKENYGLDDYIEENGANLSLAQKSLISVTKLLLKKNCSVIIIDDLGSCLDDKMQEIVYKAIYTSFPYSTIIVLTHEIKNFMEIDRAMILNNGEVAEFDSVDNLENDKKSLFNKLQLNFMEEEDMEKEEIKNKE